MRREAGLAPQAASLENAYISTRREDKTMTRLEHLQAEISSLPPHDFKALRDWIDAKDWEEWDRRIAADSAAGKLDFLKQEALAAKALDPLRGL